MFNVTSVTRRKSPNVYKSCPKMISLEKWKILTPLQNLHRNVVDLGILIAAKVLKKLPKVQNIAKSGPTECYYAYLHFCKWRNIEKTISISGHTAVLSASLHTCARR